MTGIVIVTHCRLGEALLETAEFIFRSKPEAVETVSIDVNESTEVLREKISKGIKKVRNPDGVLILTDMFGGTPSNLSYSFLEEGRIDVITGVNLPILIKAIESREKQDLAGLCECLEDFGKKSITLASRILKGNKRN